jgi:hypothetical protein
MRVGFTRRGGLNIIAQGFSPGSVSRRGALKVAPDVSARDEIQGSAPNTEDKALNVFS